MNMLGITIVYSAMGGFFFLVVKLQWCTSVDDSIVVLVLHYSVYSLIKAIKTEVVTEKWDSSFLDTSITIEKCNLGTKLFYIKKFANHHCKTLLPIPDLMFKIFISGI